jgi:hypothetical protein
MRQVTFPLFVGDFELMAQFFKSLEIFDIEDTSGSGLRQANVHYKGEGLDFVICLISPSTEAEKAAVGRQAPSGKWLLSFSVDNISRWHARMINKGLPVTPIKSYPWAKIAVVKDPSGNSYLISENLQPA